MMKGLLLLLLPALLPLQVGFAQNTDPNLAARLRGAATNVDRVALLTDEQFVFNFFAGVGASTGYSGSVVNANAGNFPALIGNGIAMSLGYLDACGLNTPHVHPRATEINIAVNGTLRTGMLAENNARFVFNDVPPGSVTVFPQGAIHFEMNTECYPTIFVAGFNHEDPGSTAVAQRFFGLPIDIVAATLDSLGVIEIADLESKIPNNIAQGVADCLSRCGLQAASNQPTSQRQPRLPSNPLPSGFSGPPPPPPPATATVFGAVDTAMPSSGNSGAATTQSPHALGVTASIWDDAHARGFFVALLVINGLFAIGVLGAVFWYVARTTRGRGLGRGRSGDRDVLVGGTPHDFAPLAHQEKDYYDPYGPPTSPPPQDPMKHHD